MIRDQVRDGSHTDGEYKIDEIRICEWLNADASLKD
jgi:hypothetical protein